MSGIETPIAKYHFMLLLIIFYMYIFIARWKTNYQVMEGYNPIKQFNLRCICVPVPCHAMDL
jgi:hypothetical protein